MNGKDKVLVNTPLMNNVSHHIEISQIQIN